MATMKMPGHDSHGSASNIYPAMALRKKAPTPWAPQTTHNRAVSSSVQAFSSGSGRSTATIADLSCQLGPNFWAVKKCNSRRLLYTTLGVETSFQSTGNVEGVTFQRSPKIVLRRIPQWDTAARHAHAAKCRSCSYGFHRRPIKSKLAAMVVRRQLATGPVKGLCTTLLPSCRQTAPICSSPAGLYPVFGIHARCLTRPVFPSWRPTRATRPALRCAAGCRNIASVVQSSVSHAPYWQTVYAYFDVAAVTTLIKYQTVEP